MCSTHLNRPMNPAMLMSNPQDEGLLVDLRQSRQEEWARANRPSSYYSSCSKFDKNETTKSTFLLRFLVENDFLM